VFSNPCHQLPFTFAITHPSELVLGLAAAIATITNIRGITNITKGFNSDQAAFVLAFEALILQISLVQAQDSD
jgi:hypothetical protein